MAKPTTTGTSDGDTQTNERRSSAPAWLRRAEDVMQKSGTSLHQKRGGNVVLLLDTSGSMSGSSLDHAKEGALAFAADATKQGYTPCLITFDCGARVVSEFGSSSQALERAVSALAAEGGTALDRGLELAEECLATLKARARTVVVVTDGYPNDEGAALAVGDRLKAAGVNIITLGTPDANSEFLARLASANRLSKVVERSRLAMGIREMSKLLALPGR